MIILNTTSDLVEIVLSVARTLDIHASYMDASGTTLTPGHQNTQTTVETTKTVVASPGSSVERAVKTLHIRNIHATLSTDVTVRHKAGATTVELHKATLAAGEKLSFVQGLGFRQFASDGAIK